MRFLAVVVKINVRMRNGILRQARILICKPLVFEIKSFSFCNFLQKKNDYKKCENVSKNKCSLKWLGSIEF